MEKVTLTTFRYSLICKAVACLLVFTFGITNLTYGADRATFDHLRQWRDAACGRGVGAVEKEILTPVPDVPGTDEASETVKAPVIEEEIEFNKAVEAVIKWIEAESSWKETLLIVTADHECGYLTGPDSGTKDGKGVWNPIKNNGKGKAPGMEYHSGDHTNSLIPLYAKGAGSQLFLQKARYNDPVRGPYLDNTSIAKVVFFLFAQ